MVQDCFKVDSFEKLGKLISSQITNHDYFKHPKTRNEGIIRKAMQDAGVLNLRASEMPHWEGPFRTGKHLDVASYLNGKERTMYRKVGLPDGDSLTGRRVVCQLALLGESTLQDVLKRALPSIVLAAKLMEQGETVQLMVCWSSARLGYGAPLDRPSFVWIEATDLSIKTLAQILDPEFFRSWIFGFRGDHGPNGQIGHGHCGGQSRTLESYSQFVRWAKELGVVNDGDICLDWRFPIEKQIEMGLAIIGD